MDIISISCQLVLALYYYQVLLLAVRICCIVQSICTCLVPVPASHHPELLSMLTLGCDFVPRTGNQELLLELLCLQFRPFVQ